MSSELRREIAGAVERIVTGRADTGFDRSLWNDLEEAGFTLLGVPESAGGSGGTLGDAAAVLAVTAREAVALPVAETGLAGWLLAQAGLTVPAGPLTVAAGGGLAVTRRADGAVTVSGVLPSVPWGRCCQRVGVLARTGNDDIVLLVPVADDGVKVTPGENLAAEPRDDVELTDVVVPGGHVGTLDSSVSGLFELRAALLRSLMISSAGEAVLDAALRHVQEREQFGRPLARFQVLQHQVAALAADVTALRASADAALHAFEAGGPGAEVAVAATKAYASGVAGTVAAVGHQLLGAIGYTTEHRLGAATTRLWAWREECGNDDAWSERLGQRVLDQASGGVWSVITGIADGGR